MAEAMAPRGPDGAGVWSQGRVALGHRRLKIIDLTEAGAQPMVDSELGTVHRLERLHLQLQGTAAGPDRPRLPLLLHQRHRGPAQGLPPLGRPVRRPPQGHVRVRDRRARQRAGTARARPAGHQTAVHHRGRARASGSRRRFPRCSPAAASTPASTPSPCTITCPSTPSSRRRARSCGACPRCRPASLVAIEPDSQGNISRTTTTYWEPDFRRRAETADWSERDWEDAVLASLRTAVKRRLVADVPVGCLLSGGVDSSLIVGLLAEAGQTGLSTFSIGFESVGGVQGDEFKYSDIVAERFDTDHHQIRIGTDRMLPALDGAIGAMSEPMVSHDCVAFYLLSQEVAKHVKVVQSGSGRRRGVRRIPLVSPDGRRDVARRRSGQLPHRLLRPGHRRRRRARHAGLPRRKRPERTVRHRALRPCRRRDRSRPRPAARHHRDAGRRSGQTGRQHDDGVGSGGPSSVPRSRPRRTGGHVPAGTQDRPRRQGRAQRGGQAG